MHVLLIEDEKSLHQEMRQFLVQAQYLVDSAYTYAEASEKLYVSSYDFVLLDLGLPGGDGLDLLREARLNDNQEASFIILTARGALDDRIRGVAWRVCFVLCPCSFVSATHPYCYENAFFTLPALAGWLVGHRGHRHRADSGQGQNQG